MGSITVGRLLAVQMMATKINTSIGRLNRAMREPRMVKHRASIKSTCQEGARPAQAIGAGT
jgi:hypothetical protein